MTVVGGSRRVSTAITMLALVATACGTPAPSEAIADPTTSPALDDAISVAGVLPDELVRTLDEVEPGTGAAALAAIEAGTLRITPGF